MIESTYLTRCWHVTTHYKRFEALPNCAAIASKGQCLRQEENELEAAFRHVSRGFVLENEIVILTSQACCKIVKLGLSLVNKFLWCDRWCKCSEVSSWGSWMIAIGWKANLGRGRHDEAQHRNYYKTDQWSFLFVTFVQPVCCIAIHYMISPPGKQLQLWPARGNTDCVFQMNKR